MQEYLKHIPQIEILECNTKIALPDGMVTIAPLSHLAELRFMMSSKVLKSSFLFWSIHPECIPYIIYSSYRNIFRFGNNKLRNKLVKYTNDGNVFFMDGANLYGFEKYLKTKINAPTYLPIPIEFGYLNSNFKRKNRNFINIIWLGRLSYDKVNSVVKIIEDISNSKCGLNINLNVVGDGVGSNKIFNAGKERLVNVNFIGILENAVLDEYLIKEVDFGIAMGTSCLEISKLNIPVAIIDYSLDKIPCENKYDWFFESTNFSLGNNVAWGISRRMTFDEMIREYESDLNNDIGFKCGKYAFEHHSIESTASKLLVKINNLRIRNHNFDACGVERSINTVTFSFVYNIIRKIYYFYKMSIKNFRGSA